MSGISTITATLRKPAARRSAIRKPATRITSETPSYWHNRHKPTQKKAQTPLIICPDVEGRFCIAANDNGLLA